MVKILSIIILFLGRNAMTKSRYNTIIKVLACICFISISFTSCAIPFSVDKVRSASLEYIKADYSGDNMHKSNADSYISVCSSVFIELLFDETTATIAIRDNNTKKVWNTLPSKDITKKVSASAIEITLSNGDNKIYTLNSQDNSVNFGNFSYSIGVDEVSVKYAFSLTKETGAKDIAKVEDDEIRADMTVTYRLKDGSLQVNINMNSLVLQKDVYLEKVTVLNNFGAYETSGTDDYIFVPDGSGALIMTGQNDDEFSPVSLSVYGENLATTKAVSDSSCLLGAFGLKSGENAYLCIIEKGDAIAQINAYRNDENTLNSVYASFLTTDIFTKETSNKTTRYYGYQYNSEIQLCYRFLSGKSATYSGMATACRENLIRNSILPAETLTVNGDHIPMIISLQAGCQDEKGKYKVLSDFEQAQSLMTLLKAKGVNNVYLQYKGLYENDSDDFNKFKASLGNKASYETMYNYLNSQKFSLFIDTNIISFNDISSTAKSVDGKAIKDNILKSFTHNTATPEFLQVSDFEDKINHILATSESVLFDGYCLNDIGKYLYSDYSSNSYSKNQTQTEFHSQIPVLATNKMLMVEHGNLYAVKGADIILNIPTSPLAYEETQTYVGIPFIQMLVHGALEYSVSSLNTTEDMQTLFLKSVEYGCLPSAYWYCTASDENLDKIYYYNNNINDMVNCYTRANQSLADLRDSRMTSHQQIQDGVYCTEYDNSIKVYVNYTNTEITVHGVVIGAKDCVTIS